MTEEIKDNLAAGTFEGAENPGAHGPQASDVEDIANLLFPPAEPSSETSPIEDADDLTIDEDQPSTPEARTRVERQDAEDLQLVARFLAGNDQAFLKLYSKYEAPLLVYCRRMIPNRVAEDAFQEIWMKIFELRKRDVQIGNFRALLFRSARNLCLNLLRLESTRSGSGDVLNKVLAKDETSFDSEQKEIQVLLRRALAKLPFEQREAFVLHEYSGYSYLEIANMMATSESNIKVRAYRARIRLRKLIASWLRLGEEDDPTLAI
jgi:RNA polymerase sigma-70 factor (ECF subfamily)